jgi:hypothetical protein
MRYFQMAATYTPKPLDETADADRPSCLPPLQLDEDERV